MENSVMKVLVWDSGTEALEEFLELGQRHVDIDLFEDINDLVEEVYEGDLVVLDLDADRKLCEKSVKKIKKSKQPFNLLYLCDGLEPKALAKHQKSKVGGDAYLRSPLDEKMLVNIIGPLMGELPGSDFYGKRPAPSFDQLPPMPGASEGAGRADIPVENFVPEADNSSDNPSRAILDDHKGVEVSSEEVVELNQKLDSVFKDALGIQSSEEILGKIEEEELRELTAAPEEISLDADLAPDLDNDLDEDLENEENKEPEMAADNDDNNEINLDDSLDLGEDEGGLELGDDGLDEGDESLELGGPEDEALELGGEEEGGLEMGDLEMGDLELGDDEPVESLDTSEDGALDLDAGDVGDLDLGGDEPPASLDTAEDGALDLDAGLDAGEDELEANAQLDLGSEDLDEGLGEDLGDDLGAGDLGADLADDGGLDLGGDDAGLDLGAEELSDESGEEVSLDLGGDDGGLDLGGEDLGAGDLGEELGESLDGDLEESLDGMELSGNDEADLDQLGEVSGLTDPDLGNDGPSDEPNDEPNNGLSDDEMFNTGGELSAESLPDSPELGDSGGGMSEHAMAQLAEIEAMMADDGGGPSADAAATEGRTGDIDISALEADPISNLQAQVSMEDEEPDYDPTLNNDNQQDPDSTGIMENPLAAAPDATSPEEVNQQMSEANSFEQHIEDQDSAYNPSAERTINDQREVLASRDDEFSRLGETIRHLRQDREALLAKVAELEEKINSERRDFTGLEAELEEKKIELSLLNKRRSKQVEELGYRLELSEEKRMILEEKMKRLEKENETLRKKANVDVGRVKARERELENKLDLLRADTETQLNNRDLKILELKRKIDTLEFDLESVQVKEKKTVDNNFAMEERMERVINTLRRAIGELEDEDAPIRNLDKIKKNLDV